MHVSWSTQPTLPVYVQLPLPTLLAAPPPPPPPQVLSNLDCLWFNRTEAKDRLLVAERMRAHVLRDDTVPLLIFPEGTCVNNEYCVMFKRGAFDLVGGPAAGLLACWPAAAAAAADCEYDGSDQAAALPDW